MITAPETIRDTVISNVHGKQDRRAEARLFGVRFVGDRSIFTNRGDALWLRNRTAYNRFFSRAHVRGYHESVELVTCRLVEQLRRVAGTGQLVDMNRWFNLAACDIISLVAFNWDIDSVSRTDATFPRYLEQAFLGTALATGKPLSWLSPSHAGQRRDAKHAVRELRAACAAQIRKHEARSENPCLLDEILSLSTHDPQFQVDEMLAMFLAGQETVAHVATFALSHVMRDRSLGEQVAGEAAEYVQEHSFRTLTGMRNMDNLLKETLRHYAPVPGLRRVLSRDTDICGYKVPKGTVTVHSMALYAHDEDTWGADHLDFNPRRFDTTGATGLRVGSGETKESAPGGAQTRHSHAFLPFGIGPRVCIGRELAKIEFKTLMASLLAQFRFAPVEGEDIAAVRLTSLKPKSGYMCYVELGEDNGDNERKA